MNNQFTFTQSMFFSLNEKTIEVDVRRNSVKVSSRTIVKSHKASFRLDDFDENAERQSYRASAWWLLAALLAANSIMCGLWGYLQVLGGASYYIGSVFFLIALLVCGGCYYYRSFDRLFYFNIPREESLSFFVHQPNVAAYEAFVSQFTAAIVYARKRRDLCSVIKGISTDFLRDDFSVVYMETLSNGGVDVNRFLEGVKQELLLSYLSKHSMGETVH